MEFFSVINTVMKVKWYRPVSVPAMPEGISGNFAQS